MRMRVIILSKNSGFCLCLLCQFIYLQLKLAYLEIIKHLFSSIIIQLTLSFGIILFYSALILTLKNVFCLSNNILWYFQKMYYTPSHDILSSSSFIPLLHEHENVPLLLLQTPLTHGLLSHSLVSEKQNNTNCLDSKLLNII